MPNPNEIKAVPSGLFALEEDYRFLGSGKEKQVYEFTSTKVGINPQPGREKDLRKEYEKVERIYNSLPEERKEQQKNLALDMMEVKKGKFHYAAAKCEKDLTDLLSEEIKLDAAYQLGSDILTGMADLHEAGFVHGDMKSDNIFLYKKGSTLLAKVGDFGKAQRLGEAEQTVMLGNAAHSPPEQRLSRASDVYGTGLLLIRLLEAGLEIPSEERIENILPKKTDAFTIFSRVIATATSGKISTVSREAEIHLRIGQLNVLENMKKLLKEMTSDNPAQRPTMAEALERYKALEKHIIDSNSSSDEDLIF